MVCCNSKQEYDITNEKRYYICRIMIYSIGILMSFILLGAILFEFNEMTKPTLAITFSLISGLFTLNLIFLLQMIIAYANYENYISNAEYFNVDPNPQII